MKHIKLLVSVFIIFLVTISFRFTEKPILKSEVSDKYEGLVILEIKNLDDATYLAIQTSLNNENNFNLEYGCAENDIIVVKFLNSNFSEEVDNAKLIENQIRESIGKREVVTIKVTVRSFSGTSKC